MLHKIKSTTAEFKLSPISLARNEIAQLQHDQSLVCICTLNGEPTPETLAENKRRETEYNRRFRAILKKYGVRKEYLDPLLARRKILLAELREVRASIAQLKEP